MILLALQFFLILSFAFELQQNFIGIEYSVILLAIFSIGQTIYLIRKYNPKSIFELFPIFNILWIFQFPIPALYYIVYPEAQPFGVQIQDTLYPFLIANLAQYIIDQSWILTEKKLTFRESDKPHLDINAIKFSFGIMFIGLWLLRLYLISTGRLEGFENEEGAYDVSVNIVNMIVQLLSCAPVALFVIYSSKNTRSFINASLLVFTELFYSLYYTGGKSGPFIQVAVFLVAFNYCCQTLRFRKISPYFIAALIVFFPYYSYKLAIRNRTLQGLDADFSLIGFLGSFDELPDYSEIFQQVVNRFDVLTTLIKTFNYYLTHGFFTEEYLLLWLKPFVPRFLWEDKGWVNLGLYVSHNILDLDGFTQAAVTSTIEGYVFFGIVGVLLLSLIHGFFMGFCIKFFVPRNVTPNLNVNSIYFSSMFLVALYFSNSFVFLRIFGGGYMFTMAAVYFFDKVLARR